MLFGSGQYQLFLTPALHSACDFLKQRALPEGGWPAYAGGALSLYHTSVVSCALKLALSGDGVEPQMASHLVANSVLAAKAQWGERLDELNMWDLAHFTELAGLESDQEVGFVQELRSKLLDQLEACLHQPSAIAIREFATAVRALASSGPRSSAKLTRATQHLLSLENVEDGGWPSVASGATSLVATAHVLEALIALGETKYGDEIRRAARYLSDSAKTIGWQELGQNSGLYVPACILRAIESQAGSDVVDAGVVALQAAVSSVGWGEAPGQPATIENTATVLIALIKCGENKFVHYRAAADRIANLQGEVKNTAEELASLRQGLERQVALQNANILADRDKLRRETNRLRSQVSRLEETVRQRERDALEESRRNRSLLSQLSEVSEIQLDSPTWLTRILDFSTALPTAALAIMIVNLFEYRQFDTVSYVSILVMLAVAAGGNLYRQLNASRRRLSTLRRYSYEYTRPDVGATPVTSVVSSYADITHNLPESVREELFHVLRGRLVDMPPDIGLKYIEDFVESIRISPQNRTRLTRWTREFLTMDPQSRLIVCDVIGRQLRSL